MKKYLLIGHNNINSMHKKLKIKLLIIQLLSILPFLLFIFYIYDLWYDTRRSQILDQNINEAKLVGGLLRDTINNGLTLSTALAKDTILIKSVTSDKENADNILKDIATNLTDFDAIRIIDNKGSILASSQPISSPQETISLSDREYFQELLQTKKDVVSTPLIGKYTNKYLIVIGSPILNKNNEVSGMVGISLDLNKFKSRIETQYLNNNHKNVVLLDKNSQVVFLTGNDLPNHIDQSFWKNASFVLSAKKDKISLIENQNIPSSNKNFIGAVVSLDDYNSMVIYMEPMENVFAPLFRIQSVIWLIILASLLFSVSLISYFLRKIKVVY